MSSVVLALVVAASGAANGTYTSAHAEMERTGRPLLVLVGADYCPGCVQMKSTMSREPLAKRVLGKVAYARVDTQSDGRLAKKLLRGSSIPQLVMYRRTKDGWKASRLVGAKSEREVERFVQTGLKDAIVEPIEAETEADADEGESEAVEEEQGEATDGESEG